MPAKRTKGKTSRKARGKRAATHDNPAWQAIYRAVATIPRGRVATYGVVAQLAGLPRRARLVGTALRHLTPAQRVPWHRVLTASGKLAFPLKSDAFVRQRNRLAREGVKMHRERVDLARYGWPQSDRSLDELLWKLG